MARKILTVLAVLLLLASFVSANDFVVEDSAEKNLFVVEGDTGQVIIPEDQLSMGQDRITDVQDPDVASDAATRGWVLDEVQDSEEEAVQNLEEVLVEGADASGIDIDLEGANIEDTGTVIYDGDQGFVPVGALEHDSITVNEGEHIDLDSSSLVLGETSTINVDGSTLSWSDLGIDQSDVSSSDVSLGNVENIAQSSMDGLALNWDGTDQELDVQTGDGITITGDQLELDANDLDTLGNIVDFSGADDLDSDGQIIEDTVDYNAGDFLTGGGEVSLGDSATIHVDPSNIDWTDVAMDQADVDPSDVDLNDLSPGEGLDGATYDGTDPETWDVFWRDASALTTDGVLDEDVVQNTNLDLDNLDVAGGSDGTDGTGFSVNSDGDVMFGGSLIFPGDVEVANAQEIEGDIIPESDSMFVLGDSAARWSSLYTQDIDASGSVDLPSGAITNNELVNDEVSINAGTGLSGGGTVDLGDTLNIDVSEIDSGQLDETDFYSLDWDNLDISQDDIDGGVGSVSVSGSGDGTLEVEVTGEDGGTVSDTTSLSHDHSLSDISDSGELAGLNSVSSSEIESNAVGETELDTGDVDNRYVNRDSDRMTGDLELDSDGEGSLQFPAQGPEGEIRRYTQIQSVYGNDDDNLDAPGSIYWRSSTSDNHGAFIGGYRNDNNAGDPSFGIWLANDEPDSEAEEILTARSDDSDTNRIGISTNSPSHKLDVSGDMRVTEHIHGSDWADLDIDQSDVSSSDVNLGNVRNVDLDNADGSYIAYDTGDEQFNVDGDTIRSGTDVSDISPADSDLNMNNNNIDNAGCIGDEC